MKKLIIIFTSLLLLLTSATFVFAQESNFRKNVILPEGETVNHDYLAVGNNVEIAGTVNGDVIVAGGQVRISGKVNGDVLAAAGQLTISGQVSQNVRIAGGQVSISGKIGRNLTLAGGSVDVGETATLGGNLVGVGGTASLNALLNGDFKFAGGDLTINNKVNGNLDAAVGSVRLSSKALVSGNFNYWSSDNASIDSSAKVVGSTSKHPPINHPDFELRGISSNFSGITTALRIMSIVSTFVLVLIFTLLFPGLSKRSSEFIEKQPWQSLGFGLLLLVVTPIVTFVLFLTIVGIPLALLLLGLYLISLFVSRVIFIYWLGKEALKRLNQKANVVLLAVVGVIIYYLLTFLPLIGGWFTFAAILFGIGTVFLAFRNGNLVASSSVSKKGK